MYEDVDKINLFYDLFYDKKYRKKKQTEYAGLNYFIIYINLRKTMIISCIYVRFFFGFDFIFIK